jgi:hypothetical protein
MIKTASAHGFTTDELHKLENAMIAANRVLASDAFKQGLLAHKDERGISGFAGSLCTPATVCRVMTEGDASLTLFIQSYSWWNFGKRSEVAHEDDSGVTFNRRFYYGEDIPSLVNTLVHEMAHAKGFEHDYGRTARRPYSIPYACGDIAENILRLEVPGVDDRSVVQVDPASAVVSLHP